MAECNIRGVGVALAEYADLTRAERIVAHAIKILPIDVEENVAAASNGCNGVGLILTLFNERGRAAQQVLGVGTLVIYMEEGIVGPALTVTKGVEFRVRRMRTANDNTL